jgi:hypothetical protein
VTVLGPGARALEVAAGTLHTCARYDDGAVRCWGAGEQLGDGTGVASSIPVRVVGL